MGPTDVMEPPAVTLMSHPATSETLPYAVIAAETMSEPGKVYTPSDTDVGSFHVVKYARVHRESHDRICSASCKTMPSTSGGRYKLSHAALFHTAAGE